MVKEIIDKFFSASAYAVVGVSANRNKFGNRVYRFMKERQFPVFPVNPKLNQVEGDKCYATVADLPASVNAIVSVVPPAATEQLVEEASKKNVHTIWMQPGAGSDAAIARATALNIGVIHHECILMFLEPVKSFHSLHRWLRKLTGSYPV